MAKTATELLKGVRKQRREMRTHRHPDDAVDDIGPVEAYRHRLTVAVDNHRAQHHIASAQIHPQPQLQIPSRGVWLHSVAAVRRRGLSFIVRHRLLLKECQTHPLIHTQTDKRPRAGYPFTGWRGDGHRGPAFPRPAPARQYTVRS